MPTSKSVNKRLKNKRARQALKETENVTQLSGGLVHGAGYGSGVGKGDFGRNRSRPVKTKKRLPFIVEHRYTGGKRSLFTRYCDTEWHKYKRYKTRKGAEDAIESMKKSRWWGSKWKYRIVEDGNK